MKIAIEGCCHGELDSIYDTLMQAQKDQNMTIDLLLICGDFQSVRNMTDLRQMACPVKFQKLNTFYKYYSGEKTAPVLTIFIGGNHEASNFLWELPYGGWVAPNIYYLGYAGVVNFGGLRIGGLTGIYKQHDYFKGHYEQPPLNDKSKRSFYHIRSFEVFLLQSLTPRFDVFLSHDWPLTIAKYGDTQALLRKKKFLRKEVQNDSLGSPPAKELMDNLRPSYWFSAHLHVKFAALVKHPDSRETRFLSLDKCLPGRDFLQILDIEAKGDAPFELQYDPEWLAILKSTAHLRPTSFSNWHPPMQGRRDYKPTSDEIAWVKQRLASAEHKEKIPHNFVQTAVVHPDNEKVAGKITNPQTTAFCDLLQVPRINEGASSPSSLPPFPSSTPLLSSQPRLENPDEINLDDDDDDDEDESEEEFTFKYDDQLRGDQEDRDWLDSLTEIQREEELTKRFEEREEAKTRFDLKKKLKASKEKQKKNKKKSQTKKTAKKKINKTETVETTGSGRNRRSATTDKQGKALAKLKQRRKKAQEDMDEQSEPSEDESDEYRRDSASEEEFEEEDYDKSDEEKEVANRDDLETVRLSRHRLAGWCHEPFFESVVVGCYVRVGIGQGNDSRNTYRMVQIVKVKEGKPYTVDNVRTNKYLVLKQGSAEKLFRISFVSNQTWTQAEYSKWCGTVVESQSAPTRASIVAKRSEIDGVKNFVYEAKHVRQLVEQKQKFRKVPTNFAYRREQLRREETLARDKGEEDKADEIQNQILELDEKALQLNSELVSDLTAIERVNQRNRESNKVKKDKDTSVETKDPFTRRVTRPVLRNAADDEETPKGDKESNSNGTPSKEAENGNDNSNAPAIEPLHLTKTAPRQENDLFSAHDFDINIDIEPLQSLPDPAIPTPSLRVSSTPRSQSAVPKRTLSLAQYKKAKGLI
eukprot:m.202541 g.202541  ORF g.202541 m.202541 type:complete len:924 (-) comp25984_c1_seq9:87-2858(-)